MRARLFAPPSTNGQLRQFTGGGELRRDVPDEVKGTELMLLS